MPIQRKTSACENAPDSCILICESIYFVALSTNEDSTAAAVPETVWNNFLLHL